MLRLTARRWLVGLTVLLTLAQGPGLSWASHGHGGGGGHIGGGGFSGGHMGGGHIGGGHIGGFSGGGFSGGSHFSAPTHHFSAPTQHFSAPIQRFNTPTQHFSVPSHTGHSIPSNGFHTPTFQNSQHQAHTPSIQTLHPNTTGGHTNWTLPTHNGITHNGITHNGALGGSNNFVRPGNHTPAVTTFGQHTTHSVTNNGLLHSGQNPYLSTNHGHSGPATIGGMGSHHLGGTLPTHAAAQHLPGLGTHNGLQGALTHHTAKPVLGGTNTLGGHQFGGHHIGGQTQLTTNVAHHLGNGNGLSGLQQHGLQNLPQFQSHHGNHSNWGLGGTNGINNGFGGVGVGNWNSSWRNHGVNHHHHHWYNGGWGGFWGFGAYAPFYWGASSWGLGGFYRPWGYGYGYGGYGAGYYNPYCVTLVQPAYASLPVNYYAQPVALPQQPVDETADANTAAYQLVDAARNDFRNGDYTAALVKLDQAIPLVPNDTVVHELRGVTLFALGDYQASAATLNAVLAVAPGMNWASLRALYPSTETYGSQLRKLEQARTAQPNDPALRFVLAYLYLVTDYQDAAVTQLKKVVELEPKDVVAQKLLESLSPAPTPVVPPQPEGAASGTAPQTDLVGTWKSAANDSTFELTLTDGQQFTWTVTPKAGPVVKQTGRYTATSDRLILESAGQETLVVKVNSLGADRFQFWANDQTALTFDRQAATAGAPPVTPDPPQPTPLLIPAPVPDAEASLPAPKTPVLGADGLPLVPVPVDATKPENLVLPVPE